MQQGRAKQAPLLVIIIEDVATFAILAKIKKGVQLAMVKIFSLLLATLHSSAGKRVKLSNFH